jgi:O-antigen ligase
MRLARALTEAEAKRAQTLILLGGVFTTLAIWTKLEDPINLPKMFVLVLFGAAVLGLALPALLNAHRLTSGYQRIALGLVGIFVIGLLISTIATDVKYTAFFGEYHRNNGAFSYFAMASLLGAGALVFNLKSSERFMKFFAGSGLLLTAYGFLQGAGQDPVGWVINYNPYITTLGNPNFTSGFLGLAAIAILYLLIDSKNIKFQSIYAVGLVCDLYILWRSGSIQGLFGFAIGATLIAIVKLWTIKKRYGQIGLLLAAIAGTPVVLAVLNIGPLASKLYQVTLQNRFDYWSAAIGMFKDHPIFGVGIDRFGEYYRQYAVQNQYVQGQITDNAHSVYMQLLATGGLLLFLPYLFLVLFITFIGLKSLVTAQGKDKLKISGLMGIWLGTVSVNIVTIDNLGVGVWFWITGGVIVSISLRNSQLISGSDNKAPSQTNKRTVKHSDNAFPISYVSSFLLGVLVLILLVPALGKSSTLFNLKNNAGSYNTQTYLAALDSESKNAQSDPQYLIQLANLALKQNAPNEAFVMINQINKVDSRSYYGNYFGAVVNEAFDKRADAIKYREALSVLDPWNTASQVELIRNYLAIGDKASAQEVAALIKRNYPGSQADIDASALLVG